MKEGWEYKKLIDVCDVYQPKTISTSKLVNNGSYYVYGANGIIGKYINYNHEESEVLLTCRGASCGNINVSKPKSWINGNAMVIHPLNEKITKEYLSYYLKVIDYSKVITGAAQPQITRSSLSDTFILYPSIDEQRRIVSYLDSSFKLIDEIKNKALKSLTEAKALFQSALAEAMEPKEGWEEKTLKEIGLTQTGTTPSKSNKAYYGNYIPFIRPSEINIDGLGTIEYNSEIMLSQKGIEAGRKFTKKSILMVCIGATIGKVGYSERDISCNQQINVLSPYNGYNYKYLYYAMSSSVFQKKVIMEGTSAQATLPIINKGKWEKLLLYIPPLPTQKQIVSRLDKLSSKVRAIEEKYQKMVEECDALKQAMLRDVFE